MPYKVVAPALTSVNETLVCDHSNENCRTVLSWSIVYFMYQGYAESSNFMSLDETPICDHSIESSGAILSATLHRILLTFLLFTTEFGLF